MDVESMVEFAALQLAEEAGRRLTHRERRRLQELRWWHEGQLRLFGDDVSHCDTHWADDG
jgi:hypothetical protein